VGKSSFEIGKSGAKSILIWSVNEGEIALFTEDRKCSVVFFVVDFFGKRQGIADLTYLKGLLHAITSLSAIQAVG
jgi:hypothetical protein